MNAPIRVLFLSNYFPPEVNALATRTWEHAREWAARGGDVRVVSGPPHFPEGRIYEGYANRPQHEHIDGVDVLRVPMYIAPNAGFVRRTLSYISYMLSAAWHAPEWGNPPDVVVASTPQFFAALAGWIVSRRVRRPFVLEIRDLWPESIVSVGAMRRGLVIRLIERLEGALYRAADHVVVVSPAFRSHVEARRVSAERITVLPNGVDSSWLAAGTEPEAIEALRTELGLTGRFVASYVGTVGMAHGLEVVLDAARKCPDPRVAFVIVGAGAEWQRLDDQVRSTGLQNVRVVEKQPRDRIPLFYALSDVSIVHLRDRPAFRRVIPSKMFESMATRTPIVLGVRGQALEILEAAGAGIAFPPEDPDGLLEAVLALERSPDRRAAMGAAGSEFVREHYDRSEIAARYWQLLQRVAHGTGDGAASRDPMP